MHMADPESIHGIKEGSPPLHPQPCQETKTNTEHIGVWPKYLSNKINKKL